MSKRKIELSGVDAPASPEAGRFQGGGLLRFGRPVAKENPCAAFTESNTGVVEPGCN
jgi:hypothetical protein